MQLSEFFLQNPRIAVAYSGGVDSSYLLYAAKTAGCVLHAYFIKSEFQPQFELDDAISVAEHIGVAITVDRLGILREPDVIANPVNRCYYCKKRILERLWELARLDGFTILCDGTNADDDEGDRPGMHALNEFGILSPLRACGLGKTEIRALSEQAGLPTYNKPAYACLATRIPAGTGITQDYLDRIECAEEALFNMGFADFRVRLIAPDTAKIQMPNRQWDKAAAHRIEILEALKPGFESVTLDMAGR